MCYQPEVACIGGLYISLFVQIGQTKPQVNINNSMAVDGRRCLASLRKTCVIQWCLLGCYAVWLL
jgi:hypothetical protein